MALIVVFSVVISLVIYIGIGLRYSKSIKELGDIIPLIHNSTASVDNSAEFSSSTVATTISLATVIVAFFELIPSLGLWLFWTVITTALGLVLFSYFSSRIWDKMKNYSHRPSLHEFIGTEFSSKRVAFVGSIFTVIGYLTAFAVELTVGSRFLAGFIPEFPQLLTVFIISTVSFIYVFLGGFKAAIVTDRVQMVFIWLLLFSLIAYFIYFINKNGFKFSFGRIPKSVLELKFDNSLIPFILGILFMNFFMYISNMGLWQRISASYKPETVDNGMKKSVLQTIISWSLFVIVCILAFIVVDIKENENLLITLLKEINNTIIGKFTIFFVILGLYGAMLSTASTQLIAVSHTLYEDIFGVFRKRKLKERLIDKSELKLSRIILLFSAVISVFVVELLRFLGFSIADLAFAIYGASLSLTPAIIFSLRLKRNQLKSLKNYAWISILAGFVSGWTIAIYGRFVGDSNLVFLSPLFSFGISIIIMGLGYIIKMNIFSSK